MKRLFIPFFFLCSLSLSAQLREKPEIAFGTLLDAQEQVKISRTLAEKLTDPTAPTWRTKGDQHRTYFFEEAGETMPYRICVPESWNVPCVFTFFDRVRKQ